MDDIETDTELLIGYLDSDMEEEEEEEEEDIKDEDENSKEAKHLVEMGTVECFSLPSYVYTFTGDQFIAHTQKNKTCPTCRTVFINLNRTSNKEGGPPLLAV